MPSIFTKIIKGEIPSYKIAEDDKHFAFLDINPLQSGHTLVVPKRELDYIFDLGDEELTDLTVFAKKIAVAMKKVLPCKRIGMSVVGLEVPHVHIHLIPIHQVSDMNFGSGTAQVSKDEMKEIADQIKGAL